MKQRHTTATDAQITAARGHVADMEAHANKVRQGLVDATRTGPADDIDSWAHQLVAILGVHRRARAELLDMVDGAGDYAPATD